MTTRIEDRIDQFSRSEANRKLSAVLWWLPELLTIAASVVLAVLIAAVVGSFLAAALALVPAVLAGLRIAALAWLNRTRNRMVRAAAAERAQTAEDVSAADLVTLEVLR